MKWFLFVVVAVVDAQFDSQKKLFNWFSWMYDFNWWLNELKISMKVWTWNWKRFQRNKVCRCTSKIKKRSNDPFNFWHEQIRTHVDRKVFAKEVCDKSAIGHSWIDSKKCFHSRDNWRCVACIAFLFFSLFHS